MLSFFFLDNGNEFDICTRFHSWRWFFSHDAQQRSLDLDGRVVEASGPIAAPHDATGRDDQQQQEDQGRAHGQNCVRDQKTTTVWHLTMGDKTPYQYKQK